MLIYNRYSHLKTQHTTQTEEGKPVFTYRVPTSVKDCYKVIMIGIKRRRANKTLFYFFFHNTNIIISFIPDKKK